MQIPTLPIPEKVILPQANVAPDGKLYAGLGWAFSGDVEAGVWVKARPATPAIAHGLVEVINGLREQVGAKDDSPGVLTLAEVAEVLFGVAVGKR